MLLLLLTERNRQVRIELYGAQAHVDTWARQVRVRTMPARPLGFFAPIASL